MKQIIILPLFFIIFDIHSLEYEMGINFGTMGVNISSDTGLSEGYVYGKCFNLEFQSSVGVGFVISPFHFSTGIKNKDVTEMTFVNVDMFYNFFKINKDNLRFSPFVSINAVSYVNPAFVKCRAGLTFSLNYESYPFYFTCFNIDAGYAYNINNKQAFFVSVGVDIIGALALLNIFSSTENSKYSEYQEQHPFF
jgi:hypothetical protein